MESKTKLMGDVIKTKVVDSDYHKVKVFYKSLSHKKHLYGNETRGYLSLPLFNSNSALFRNRILEIYG